MSSSSELTRREPSRAAALRQLVAELDRLADAARRLAEACRDDAPTLERRTPLDRIMPAHVFARGTDPRLAAWLARHYQFFLGGVVALALVLLILIVAII